MPLDDEQEIQVTLTPAAAAVLYRALEIAVETTEPKLKHKTMQRFRHLLLTEIAGYKREMAWLGQLVPELTDLVEP